MHNPLLDLTDLPRFGDIRPEHVEPAIDRVLKDNRTALAALLEQSAAGWEQVIEPLETMSHRLGRIWAPVGHLNSVVNSEGLREAYNRCLPKLSEYSTELGQNEALFQAYTALADSDADLNPAQRKVVDNGLRDFRLSGVALSGPKKERFRDLMQELSSLQARFEENLLDATNAWSRQITDLAELEGLPADVIERAASAAADKDLKGWLLELDFPTYHAVLSYCHNESLRRDFYEAWTTRASECGPHAGRWDNTRIMEQILAARHEAAGLLGFPNYAEYSLATKMADNTSAVLEFLHDLASRSRTAARQDFEEIAAHAGPPLQAWDVAYHAERLRRERYAISDDMLRPYFPVHGVMSGMFRLVETLFGIRISEAPGPGPDTWHDDVRYYEVSDHDGPRGGFYVDLFARARKRGGAWMDDCIGRSALSGELQRPVAFLVCNFMPPTGSRPALLTHDEVVTLFHEFGHTLHHLLTRVDYPSVAGINGVVWDAVELPSQFLENFAWCREVLPSISGHYETGEDLPDELIDKLLGSRNFQSGMQMVRQLEFSLFDFRIHAADHALDGAEIARVLSEVRDEVAVVPYPGFNRFANGFSHIFAGGYAAGYYSYKWAELLSADAFAAFEESGVLNAETGRRFLESILEVGGSVDAMDTFIAFRGRKPQPDALLRQSGIASGQTETAT
ncbi:MAG: M3 family metallopeptidase [Gammaproteobacteria bacterium]